MAPEGSNVYDRHGREYKEIWQQVDRGGVGSVTSAGNQVFKYLSLWAPFSFKPPHSKFNELMHIGKISVYFLLFIPSRAKPIKWCYSVYLVASVNPSNKSLSQANLSKTIPH